MANNHVSPKRNITPLMLINKRMIVCLSIVSFFRAAVPLLCLTTTTTILINMTVLKMITVRIGAKKAPQKAPTWDKKQLHQDNIMLDIGHGILIQQPYRYYIHAYMLRMYIISVQQLTRRCHLMSVPSEPQYHLQVYGQ